jgi:hypothetical protein
MKLILFLSLTLAGVYAIPKSYEGYKLYKVFPQNEIEVNVLEDIRDRGVGEFWVDYFQINSDIRVMVAPEQDEEFLETLYKNGVGLLLIFNNLQE